MAQGGARESGRARHRQGAVLPGREPGEDARVRRVPRGSAVETMRNFFFPHIRLDEDVIRARRGERTPESPSPAPHVVRPLTRGSVAPAASRSGAPSPPRRAVRRGLRRLRRRARALAARVARGAVVPRRRERVGGPPAPTRRGHRGRAAAGQRRVPRLLRGPRARAPGARLAVAAALEERGRFGGRRERQSSEVPFRNRRGGGGGARKRVGAVAPPRGRRARRWRFPRRFSRARHPTRWMPRPMSRA